MGRTQSSPAPKSNPSARQNGTMRTTTATSANGTSGPAATAVRTFVAHQHANGPTTLKSAQPPQHTGKSVTTPSKTSRTNGHTYLPTHAPAPTTTRRSQRPVTESTDTAFESGAWLFDASRMPAWLAHQLQPASGRTPVKAAFVKGKQQAKSSSSARQQQPTEVGQVIRLGSRPVREQPVDIGFDSGAWLFDESQRPEWLSSELLQAPSSKSSKSGKSSSSRNQQTRAAANGIDRAAPAPPSPTQHRSSNLPTQNPLSMSWAQIAASPPTSPNRTFNARPPSGHRDPPSGSKRSRSVPHRRIQRNPHHLARPSPSTTTFASTTQALDLPPATHDDESAAAAYTLHSSNPTYPLSLPAAHARMHMLHYAHRAAADCGPVPLTSAAADRVRDSMHARASRALATFALVCLVMSVSLAGLVARTDRPLVPTRVGARWVGYGVRGDPGHLVVGGHGARERLRMEQQMRNAWVVEADEGGVQGKVIYA